MIALHDVLLPYTYQINVGGGAFLTVGLTGIFLLMAVIWPNTRLKALTLWFMGCLVAVMWRWMAAVLMPAWFGIEDSLLPAAVFCVAGVSTFVLMIVAWWEYVRDGRR